MKTAMVLAIILCTTMIACKTSDSWKGKPMPTPTATPARGPFEVVEPSVESYCWSFRRVAYTLDAATAELVAHMGAVETDPEVVNDPSWKNDGFAVRIHYEAVAREIRGMDSVPATNDIHSGMLTIATLFDELAVNYEAATDSEDATILLEVVNALEESNALLNALIPRIKAVCG